jgi:competence protein ComFC
VKFLNLIKSYSTRLFFPSFCRSCESLIEQDFIFCFECYSKIRPIVSFYLKITNTKNLKVFAVSDYKDPLKSLILDKLYSKNYLASIQLGQLIYKKTVIKNLDIDFLIPVPLHWTRFSKRGYNQAFIIADELSKYLDVPVLDILKRNKKTDYQSRFSLEFRQKNVENIFDIKDSQDLNFLLKDKNILLVDDLCTTGATLKNCAKVLIKYKIKSINAAVACRVA